MSVTIDGSTGISAIQDGTVNTDSIVDEAVTSPKFGATVTEGFSRREIFPVTLSISGNEIFVTDIPAWAKRVTLGFYQVSTNSTSPLKIQLGTSSGYATTGYTSSSAKLTNSGAVSVVSETTGFVINSIIAADETTGLLTLQLVDDSANVWICCGNFRSSTTIFSSTAGETSLASVLTSIRVTTVAETPSFDNGYLSLYVEG